MGCGANFGYFPFLQERGMCCLPEHNCSLSLVQLYCCLRLEDKPIVGHSVMAGYRISSLSPSARRRG